MHGRNRGVGRKKRETERERREIKEEDRENGEEYRSFLPFFLSRYLLPRFRLQSRKRSQHRYYPHNAHTEEKARREEREGRGGEGNRDGIETGRR